MIGNDLHIQVAYYFDVMYYKNDCIQRVYLIFKIKQVLIVLLFLLSEIKNVSFDKDGKNHCTNRCTMFFFFCFCFVLIQHYRVHIGCKFSRK